MNDQYQYTYSYETLLEKAKIKWDANPILSGKTKKEIISSCKSIVRGIHFNAFPAWEATMSNPEYQPHAVDVIIARLLKAF